MLLRRFSQHVRAQNWTAVGLDIAVVIVGVLVAFQVNEWRDLRQQRARETVALQRLHQEADSIVSYLTRMVSQYDEYIANEDKAVASLSDGSWSEVDPELLAMSLDSLGFFGAISPPRSVYDELSSSGGLSEISDARVRTVIAFYYAELSFIQSQLAYFRDATLRDERLSNLRGVYDPTSDLRM